MTDSDRIRSNGLTAVRNEFLSCAGTARDLIAHPDVAMAWDLPSALEQLTVGGLSSHLSRAVATVISYLDGATPGPGAAESLPSGGPVSAVQYMLGAITTFDLGAPLHAGIRDRSEAGAADGPVAIVRAMNEAIMFLTEAMHTIGADRHLEVFGGMIMVFDDYLETRLAELVIHLDDLAASVGIDTPGLPASAIARVVDNCFAAARARHGDRAVLTAMARPERDVISRALRVF